MIESTNLQNPNEYEHSVVLSRFQGTDNPNQIINESMVYSKYPVQGGAQEYEGVERSINKPYELTHHPSKNHNKALENPIEMFDSMKDHEISEIIDGPNFEKSRMLGKGSQADKLNLNIRNTELSDSGDGKGPSPKCKQLSFETIIEIVLISTLTM